METERGGKGGLGSREARGSLDTPTPLGVLGGILCKVFLAVLPF